MQREGTKAKEHKGIQDNKLKALRKEKEQLAEALQEIRSVVLGRVEFFLSSQQPAPSQMSPHSYEAAQVLGLKAGEL